jgi:HAD superfamily hydrolase (TIGR01549 family)
MAAGTLLFDLDGTLWDSHPWYGAALEAESGLTREATIARLRAGHNVVRLAREFGLTDSRFNRLCYDAVAELRLYPDVPEVLRELGERGALTGVVTNLPKRLVEPVLGDLGLLSHFATTIYAARKPGAGGLHRALSELCRGIDNTVFYVGDTEVDALAAERAGISFAWASYGYSETRPPHTAAVLGRFADVLEL